MGLVLNFDGACWPNPNGTATYGWVLTTDFGAVVASGKGVAATDGTNNVGEYFALGMALLYVQGAGLDPTDLAVRGDSQLVVKQMAGEWACNVPRLGGLRERCRARVAALEAEGWRVRLEWVPRDQNAAADDLSSAAYLEATGRRLPEFKKRK